jgi:hypothetical protein
VSLRLGDVGLSRLLAGVRRFARLADVERADSGEDPPMKIPTSFPLSTR